MGSTRRAVPAAAGEGEGVIGLDMHCAELGQRDRAERRHQMLGDNLAVTLMRLGRDGMPGFLKPPASQALVVSLPASACWPWSSAARIERNSCWAARLRR